jgi:hypothetical protein
LDESSDHLSAFVGPDVNRNTPLAPVEGQKGWTFPAKANAARCGSSTGIAYDGPLDFDDIGSEITKF